MIERALKESPATRPLWHAASCLVLTGLLAVLPAVLPAVLLAVLLAGCASAPPAPVAAPPSSLIVERQWLQAWFRGTPVRITQRADGRVAVAVPLRFCFDSGRSRVKPPLAAVLGKVAESLHRRPHASLPRIAAAGDARSASALGLQRAQSVRDYLRARGVPARQLGPPSSTADAEVGLLMAP
ncbi:MAG: hypothetical protein KGI36_05295 [Burkholderiales bacterium]|nr:hypothetical protein [Burkholderiales bacterium]